MRRTLKAARLPGLAVAAALALAACGDDEETTSTMAEPTATTATTSTSPTAEEPTATEPAAPEGPADETGGGTEGTPAVDPDAADPERAATAFLVSTDTELVCGELIAPPLLGTTYGSLAACRNGRPPNSLAESVDARRIEEQGTRARVTLVPDGGVYDGVPVDFLLTSDGTRWLIADVRADVPVGP